MALRKRELTPESDINVDTYAVNNSDFIVLGNFEVGIYFRDQRAHCYPLQVATGSGGAGRAGRFGT